MLLRLFTNRDEFVPIDFKPGFNAIVAERAGDSTAQNTRNARGKSTLLMFINYVLAGNRDGSLVPLAEAGWEISLTLELFGGRVTATRALDKGTRLTIEADPAALAVVGPFLTDNQVSLADWKLLLGLSLFRLEPEASEGKGAISVRTLLSYVIRTNTPKDPLKILAQQGAISSRQHIAFMLGLDWEVVHKLADIGRGIDQLDVISAATRDGLMTTLRPEEELLLERAALRNEAQEWSARISSFRILEDPNHLVQRADELTGQIAVLRDEAVTDIRMRELYETSLMEQPDHSREASDIARIYETAGLALASGAKRRLQEVEAFHASLLVNRRSFLGAELVALKERIANGRRELEVLDQQRDGVLRALESGGAFEELAAMRQELAGIEARSAAVDLQIDQARELVGRKEELKLNRATLRKEATHVLSLSRAKLDHVNDRFSQKMKSLYGKDAALSVGVDNDGYKFSLKVTGAGSTGVDRMTLFCFDLTLLEEGVRTAHHPDFLVHDSSVFDGVDPRQRAGAFQFAQAMIESSGGQYICTINSNDIPDDVFGEPWFLDGIVRTVLDTEPGGLIGLEF